MFGNTCRASRTKNELRIRYERGEVAKERGAVQCWIGDDDDDDAEYTKKCKVKRILLKFCLVARGRQKSKHNLTKMFLISAYSSRIQ